MHPFSDPHEPTNELNRLDGIVLAALGEPVDPALQAHHDSCVQCSQERADLRHTVRLARETVEPLTTPDVRPPASVWAGIAAELGFGTAPVEGLAHVPSAVPPGQGAPDGASVGATRHGLVGRRPRGMRSGRVTGRHWLIAAALLLALSGATAIGYSAGHRSTAASAACPGTRATLQQMAGGPKDVGGQVALLCSKDGPALRVTTSKLPLRNGFYEVWLYAPASNTMVAVGTLGGDGTGSFTLPAGVNLRDFHVVDVSAQLYNGNPAHDQSVLRGPLTS